MLKYKTLIVEDESAPLERLRTLLSEHSSIIDLNTLKVAQSFREAQKIILDGKKFDLSILDYKLDSGKTCFDLITKENRASFGVIALNTIDEKVQEQFKNISNAGGFLVLRKPYNEEDVFGFIAELNVLKRGSVNEMNSSLPILIQRDGALLPVEQKDLVYLEINDNLCSIFYLSGESVERYDLIKQLIHYEKKLDSILFQRISDKHLLNVNFIKEILPGSIVLKAKFNGQEILLPVSDTKWKELSLRYLK